MDNTLDTKGRKRYNIGTGKEAYVGSPQEALLEACGWFGDAAQKEHLQKLLEQNRHYDAFL